jgi:hypothetical protein
MIVLRAENLWAIAIRGVRVAGSVLCAGIAQGIEFPA